MQKINLYCEQKKQIKFNFQYKDIVKFTLYLIGILLFFTVYQIGENIVQYISLSSIRSEKIALQKEFNKMENLLSKREQESLINSVKKIEEEMNHYQTLLTSLKNMQQTHNDGFDLYLKALGESAVSGAWLTRFDIMNGGRSVALEGNALHADKVTKLMRSLGEQPIFQGKTFQLFTMGIDEKSKFLKFNIKTDIKNEVSRKDSQD